MKSFRLFDPKNEINFVKYFKPMLVVAALVPVVAIVGALVIGINWGLDFRGGTEMQVEFNTDVPSGDIEKALESAGFTKHQVQRYGAAGSTQRLIRVERLETFKPEDVTRIESLVASKLRALRPTYEASTYIPFGSCRP